MNSGTVFIRAAMLGDRDVPWCDKWAMMLPEILAWANSPEAIAARDARIAKARKHRAGISAAALPPPTSTCAVAQVPPAVPPDSRSIKAPAGIGAMVTMASSSSLLNSLNRPSDSEKASWAKVIAEVNARI